MWQELYMDMLIRTSTHFVPSTVLWLIHSNFPRDTFLTKRGIHFCPRDRKVRSCSIIDDLPGQALSYLSPPDLSLAIIHHKLKLYSGGAAPAPLSAQPFVQRSSCLLHLEPLEGAGFKTCSSAPLLFGADGHRRTHLSNSGPLATARAPSSSATCSSHLSCLLAA